MNKNQTFQDIIILEVLDGHKSTEETQLHTLLVDMTIFIATQASQIKQLGPLHTLIQNQIHALKLKMLTGRGSYHIWIKREDDLNKNWATIIIG